MGSAFFYSFIFFLLVAPLYKAGNRAIPLLLLELMAVGLLVALALKRGPLELVQPFPWTLKAALGLLFVYPLIQLIPLPVSLWAVLPGHATYADVLARFAEPAGTTFSRAISIVPSATEYGWLAMLPPLAAFLFARWMGREQAVRLILIMSIYVGIEALLGLLQVGSGGQSIFYLRNDQAYGTATGTFVNRNHFAAMMAMMLPVIIGLLAFGIRQDRRRSKRGRSRNKGFQLNPENLPQRMLLFAAAIAILLCLIFTRSRGGIGSALVGLAFSAILLARARGSSPRVANILVGALVLMAILLAAVIGLAPVLERVEPQELRLSAEDRFAIYVATLQAAIDFLPFGSGLNTFADVFLRYQVGIAGYLDFAHDDYLQFFMEFGLVAPVVVALLIVAYVARMTRLLTRHDGRSFTLLQIGAGVGLLPMMLHSLVDFSLHMPANAIWYATLVGLVFHPGVEVSERTGEVRTFGDEVPAGAATGSGALGTSTMGTVRYGVAPGGGAAGVDGMGAAAPEAPRVRTEMMKPPATRHVNVEAINLPDLPEVQKEKLAKTGASAFVEPGHREPPPESSNKGV